MSVKEYNANELISALAAELKKVPECKMPEWAVFVKTGVARNGPPTDADWWYVRSASILRKIALIGPIGVNKLRREYGGKNRKGYAPAHFQRASGKIIRVVLQQLEKAGFVKQIVVSGHKGRVMDKKGQELLSIAAKTSRAAESKKDTSKTQSSKATGAQKPSVSSEAPAKTETSAKEKSAETVEVKE